MVNICPDIPDSWRGSRAQTAVILDIDPKTLDRYTRMGRRGGGIDHHISRASGRKFYLGKDIKRFFLNY